MPGRRAGAAMIVRYFVAGRLLLTDTEHMPPRKGDEVAIDGKCWEAARVVLHIEDCPPDEVHVHPKIAEAEHVWPAGHP